jgi:fructose-bisphosphate aldolase, class II
VEGELGVLSGIEEDIEHAENKYTDPALVEDFVQKTGVNSLAISIGTSHGVFKLKVKKGEPLPPLRFDILKRYKKGFQVFLSSCMAPQLFHPIMFRC